MCLRHARAMHDKLLVNAFLYALIFSLSSPLLQRNQKKIIFPKTTTVTAIKELIEGLGYMYEQYHVTTEDGYILNLNRMVTPSMKKKRNRGVPMLLINGFFMHSEAWLLQDFVDDNIAGAWAKRGYDVWLGDQRGTLRSLGHVNRTITQEEYWNHSFHEVGVYDLPAFIDFILNKTGHERVVYSCISLGCSFHFVMCSERPEYNDKLLGGLDFVPVGKVPKQTDLPMQVQLSFVLMDMFLESYEKAGIYAVRQVDQLKKEARLLCGYTRSIVFLGFHVFLGRGTHLNKNVLCSQISLALGGTSIKTIAHVLQMYKTGEFAQFDYGKEGNVRRYGTEFPPLYNFTKITSFVAFYYGEFDVLMPTPVVKKALKELGGPTYDCEMVTLGHLDVAIGTTFKYVFPDVNEVLDSISGYSNNTEKAMSRECPERIRIYG